MNRFASLVCLAAVQSAGSSGFAGKALAQPSSHWSGVEQALGRKGAVQPGGVIKFGFPRGDLQVTVAGVVLKPALALGSWVAFRQLGKAAIAVGDLVLVESEVPLVIRQLEESGIRATALHNHLLGESPRVMYLHLAARGDATELASAIHAALALTGTPLGAPSVAPAAPLDLDTGAIAGVIGAGGGHANGGVFQLSHVRRDRVTIDGVELLPSMGVATAFNFQPTGGGKAAVTGDFVLTSAEVDPVVRALGQAGIAVTALHSHLVGERPHLWFLHFWVNDDAVKVATGLRAALDLTH
jgi:Domain of Unknown Function (DUF1259)